MGQLFGTDGVRGAAGRELTAGLALGLASAAASVLAGVAESDGATASSRRPFAVVGRDPRASGEFLEAAVVAGVAASGVDVVRLGVMPTPAVAYLTAAMDAEFGVVLSASHNPAPDNGIKFFARGGVKLPDTVEDEIEARLAGQNGPALSYGPDEVPAAGFGRVRDAADQGERYLEYLLDTVSDRPAGAGRLAGAERSGAERSGAERSGAERSGGAGRSSGSGESAGAARPLAGMRVVVDCAHGAASGLAPELLRRAGADVSVIGAEPDGLNINQGCGSTSLAALSAAVLASGADAGIAHDGDADRCLAVDASGQVIDGDQILAVLAIALKAEGRLAGNTVVATVMSNLGFRHAMRAADIDVVETPVGDRYLIAAMLDGKYVLGGEQSGHIIMLDHATTGDGMLTGLHLLAEAARQGRPLADLASVVTRYPQVLINVPGVDKALVTASALLRDAVATAEAELADSGRVLVRPSGTEAAVRVMVEAADTAQAERLATRLADTIRQIG